MSAQGPISLTGLIGQKEIILVWDEGHDSTEIVIHHQVAGLVTGYQGQPDLNQRFEFGDKKTESDGSYGDRQLAVAAGDFNGDGLSEYVAASMAGNIRIRLRIPELVDSTLTYSGSRTLLAGSRVDNESDVHVHDLNRDGLDEVITGFRPESPGQGVFVKVYELNGSTFDSGARKLIDNNILTANSETVTIAVTAGRFDLEGNADIALAWGRIDSCDGTGNILSYTPYNDLDNPDQAEILRGS